MNLRRAGRWGGVGLFLAATCLAGGVAAGVALQPHVAPADLSAPEEVTSAQVTPQSYADQRTVPVRLSIAADRPIAAARDGRLTQTACRANRRLASGATVARIDDQPVIGLATDLPLYRDLAKGAKGGDVQSLQRELRRLGYRVGVDGRFGSGTRTAVKALQRKAGIAKPDGKITVGNLLWLPSRTVVPATCDAREGDSVVTGTTTLFTVAGRLTSVGFTRPDALVPGKRTLSLYGVDTRARGDRLTEAKFLDAVAATPDYQAYLLDGKKAEVTATMQLSNPIEALKVPPGAVFGLDGDHGCVQVGERAVPVTVVGAGLGAVLVTAKEPLATVNLGAAITRDSCRRAS